MIALLILVPFALVCLHALWKSHEERKARERIEDERRTRQQLESTITLARPFSLPAVKGFERKVG